jgi:SAM-dependent methyltransferase
MAPLAAHDIALGEPDLTESAYDGLAAHYDAFTSGYDYERWFDVLEGLAVANGLPGRRLLDVGCGTGKSFLGMLERGYEVVACDLSPEMVARARKKVPDGRAEVFVADMRALPELGKFDFVTCLDDAVNYLTSQDQLRAAFEGFGRNLRPGGIAIFDANTLRTFRSAYAETFALDSEGSFFCVRGEGEPDLRPGGTSRVWIEVFSPAEEDLWRRTRTRHVHRHHPRWEVERAASDAGFEVVATRGQSPGVQMSPEPDEELHWKTVYVLRRRA